MFLFCNSHRCTDGYIIYQQPVWVQYHDFKVSIGIVPKPKWTNFNLHNLQLAVALEFFQLQGHVFSGTGTITGKFDCGYLVTVRLGSEVLKGVLYHPEEPVQSDASPEPINVRVPDTKPSGRRSRLRRRSRRREDPNHPKPNRSGYNFFFAEKHCKFKSLYPNREREFTKMIGESWTNLTAEERMVITILTC